jgi:hypothetical protein
MVAMPPPRTLGDRVTRLETKVAEVDSCHSETQYKMNRRLIKVELGVTMLLEHFNIGTVPDHAVDEVLDQE